ncbi:tetratricopeptide repeat protein [Actinophytocola sp. NPDC049390]|uniref:tetratricopeptide repeat protein n=1 Tax=Actinophytocola sp. NPDC049390 TaxID=3363894 RepID=UPI00379A4E3E
MAVPPAVHRTVLVVDVSAFGDPRRTNLHQLAIRRAMYQLLERALDEAGVRWRDCHHEDRGDGVLVVIAATVPKSVLVEKLLDRLVTALRAHNSTCPEEERIRLRLSLHAGEVHHDDHGVAGRAVNLAFRLIDSAAFKQAHELSTGLLAIVVSDWFFDEVVWHSETAERDTYRQIHISEKETDTPAWVRLVDGAPLPGNERPRHVVSPVPHQLPPATRQFVGREAELTHLTELVTERAGLVIATIDGMAGVGKTALALTWTHRVRHLFPDGQLHVDLRGFDEREPMDSGEALHGFLQALGVSAHAIPIELDAKTALYRSLLAERRMLVVLDNARSSNHVRPLLPASPTCAVVITSRDRMDSVVVRDGAHRIALDALPESDALALLAERVAPARLRSEPEATAELIELCVRLPLALSVAAAQAASQPALSIGTLVRGLRDERHRLDRLSLGDADLSPRAVFSWSYAVLTAAAARLFRLLGAHPGTDVGVAACLALVGDQAPAALRELTRAHLLTEYVPGRFRFHDLVRAYATELCADDPERRAAVDRLVDHYLRTTTHADRIIQPHRHERAAPDQPPANPEVTDYESAIAWFSREHTTLQAMVGVAAEHGFVDRAWRLAWAGTTYIRRSGRWGERVDVQRTALAAVVSGGDRLGQAVMSRHLASSLARLGHHDEAVDLLDRAAALYHALGDHDGIVKNHLVYARVLGGRGNHSEALAHARAAWELSRDGDSPLARADALIAMGQQMCALERHEQARPLCSQALELYGSIGQVEGQADALLTLGEIAETAGEYENAITCYRESARLDRQLGDRYWEAVALEHLADACRDPATTMSALREALDIYREIHHPAADRVLARLTSS